MINISLTNVLSVNKRKVKLGLWFIFFHEDLSLCTHFVQSLSACWLIIFSVHLRCPEKWIRFGSSCYFFSGESKTWDEAREFCRARGADLVVINTEGENLFVSALKKQDVWIGLTDTVLEGTWKWVDGSPLTLQFWGSDQPDDHNGEEDCGHIHDGFPGLWNDIKCHSSMQWIFLISPL
uniref:C-type lectin domain-containing protein n=1 Tax=Oryzias latipes TaxID=8090 RepID=A0A3B3H7P2_ORYLA